MQQTKQEKEELLLMAKAEAQYHPLPPYVRPGTVVIITRPDICDEQDVVRKHGVLWQVLGLDIEQDAGEDYVHVTQREPDNLGESGSDWAILYRCKSLATGHEYEWYDEEFFVEAEDGEASPGADGADGSARQ